MLCASTTVVMLPLVLVSIVLCGVACAYICVRRAGRAASSLLTHCGAAIVMALVLSQYGALLKADSLKISKELLSYCVCAMCGVCLLYFLLVLTVCRRIQGCVAQFVLISVIVLAGLCALFLEFGGVLYSIDSHFEPYLRLLTEYVMSLSPFNSS